LTQQFLRLLGRIAEFVPIVYPVRECRDPKDNKFLEVDLAKPEAKSLLC
jgi:predicted nucleic acid-binding protein